MLTVKAPVAIKRVLAAVDFSPVWEIALPVASTVASHFGANLTLLNAVARPRYTEDPLDPIPTSQEIQRQNSVARLDSMLSAIPLPSDQKNASVVSGDAVESVISAIAEHDIDLVVVATHAPAGVTRLLTGSTAEKILRLASCPVLSVGPHISGTHHLAAIQTILVAIDFSEESLRAVQFATALAEHYRARIVLLNVVDEEWALYQIESALNFADREIARINTSDIPTERIVRVGRPATEIAEAEQRFGASCIVAGRHNHGLLSAHLPLTTLHSVLAQATCPVFTVA